MAGQQIAFHANATGHSIARPIAFGNRVPPQRTVLRETTDPLAGEMWLFLCSPFVKMRLEQPCGCAAMKAPVGLSSR